MKGRKSLGNWGEKIAAEYLIEKGYSILERNYRSPYGEIDLVVQIDKITVFVEVKTRSSTRFGYPEEAVTRVKMEHLFSTAQAYLQNHPEISGDWRIDVIAIARGRSVLPEEILHFENILTEIL
jgi:putative endonuclease